MTLTVTNLTPLQHPAQEGPGRGPALVGTGGHLHDTFRILHPTPLLGTVSEGDIGGTVMS